MRPFPHEVVHTCVFCYGEEWAVRIYTPSGELYRVTALCF